MRSGAVAAAEDVPEVRLHYDARGVIPGKTAQISGEPLAGADTGGDEILEGLSLRRHGIFISLDRVIPGGGARGDDLCTPALKAVGFLLLRACLCVSARRQADGDSAPAHACLPQSPLTV